MDEAPLAPAALTLGEWAPHPLPAAGGFFSDSALPGQKLIAEGLRSHLCF